MMSTWYLSTTHKNLVSYVLGHECHRFISECFEFRMFAMHMVGYHRIASQPKIETISFSPCVLYSTYWTCNAGISHTGRPGFS